MNAAARGPLSTEPDAPRRGPRRWIVLAVGAVVAMLATAVLVGTTVDDSDDPEVDPSTTTTGDAGSPTSTTTTSAPATGGADTALWPPAGSSTSFTSPADAARSFAVEFLGFRSPVVEAFAAGDARSGEVPVRPSARGPVTTILVRQLGPDNSWRVLAAMTRNIEVDRPEAGAEISSPVRVGGRAVAFEGTVQVEVRADGVTDAVGSGFVTGGGDRPGPFEGSISFEAGSETTGSLVLFTRSAENGEVWEAMAIRVRLRSPGGTAGP